MANAEPRKHIKISISSSENIPGLADLSSVDRIATLHQFNIIYNYIRNLKKRFGKYIEINFDLLADSDEIEDTIDQYRQWEAENEKETSSKDTEEEQTTMTQTTQELQTCHTQNECLSKTCKQEECLEKSQSGDLTASQYQTVQGNGSKTLQASQSQEDNKILENGNLDHFNEEEIKGLPHKRLKTLHKQEDH